MTEAVHGSHRGRSKVPLTSASFEHAWSRPPDDDFSQARFGDLAQPPHLSREELLAELVLSPRNDPQLTDASLGHPPSWRGCALGGPARTSMRHLHPDHSPRVGIGRHRRHPRKALVRMGLRTSIKVGPGGQDTLITRRSRVPTALCPVCSTAELGSILRTLPTRRALPGLASEAASISLFAVDPSLRALWTRLTDNLTPCCWRGRNKGWQTTERCSRQRRSSKRCWT